MVILHIVYGIDVLQFREIDNVLRLIRNFLSDDTIIKQFNDICTLAKLDTSYAKTLCKTYIEKNIIDLYTINNINIYQHVSGYKLYENVILQSEETLTDKDLLLNNFQLIKNAKVINNGLSSTILIVDDSRYFNSLGFSIDLSRV